MEFENCTVSVTENGNTLFADEEFSYLIEETPVIHQVSPNRGGTGGGTLLTIDGINFPNDTSNIIVKISDFECKIESISANQILCRTEPCPRSAIKAPIEIFIQNIGLSLNKVFRISLSFTNLILQIKYQLSFSG